MQHPLTFFVFKKKLIVLLKSYILYHSPSLDLELLIKMIKITYKNVQIILIHCFSFLYIVVIKRDGQKQSVEGRVYLTI